MFMPCLSLIIGDPRPQTETETVSELVGHSCAEITTYRMKTDTLDSTKSAQVHHVSLPRI